MVARSISETAVMIIGPPGRERSLIDSKLGHSLEKVVTIEATIASETLFVNLSEMEVVLGERSEGMNETNDSSTLHKSRVLRFGSRGSPTV